MVELKRIDKNLDKTLKEIRNKDGHNLVIETLLIKNSEDSKQKLEDSFKRTIETVCKSFEK